MTAPPPAGSEDAAAGCDHDHVHDHPDDLDVDPDAPVDPGRRRRWRASVAVGAAVALLGWVGAPLGHVLTVERPLRHIEASPWLVGLTGAALVGSWLLTATPEPAPASPHRVGAQVLRGASALALGLAVVTWALGPHSGIGGVIAWLSWPLAVGLLALFFGYVGRLHRLLGQERMANLADLAGVVLPVLWLGSQMIGGYPEAWMWGPGVAAMGVGGVAVAGVGIGAVRDEQG